MPLEPYRYQSYCRIVWWHGLGMLRYALEPLALPWRRTLPRDPYRYQSYCRIVWWHGLGMLRYALEPLALPPMPRGGSPVEIDNALDQGSIGRQLAGPWPTFARAKPYSPRIW